MPISPNEVVAVKTASIPDWVFAVWDKLIAQEWNGFEATIYQSDAVAALEAANPGTVVDIFRSGWLDIENAYRAVGWKVVYDKPGYCESYKAHFTFRK